MMKTINYKIMFIIILVGMTISHAEQKSLREIFDQIIYKDEPYASSELIEKGMPKDFYSAKKAFDGKVETAWVEGVEGDGIGEYIYLNLHFVSLPMYDDFKDNKKKIEVEITIVNGVAKNKQIWEMNNRIKRAELEIYEAPVVVRQIEPCIISKQEPVINSKYILNFKDDMKPQKFLIKLDPKQKWLDGRFLCIGKLIIKEVYPGTKYKDTGISEINARRIDED